MSKANTVRRVAYRVARTAGDMQALQRGRIPQRVGNRLMGKAIGRVMRKVWF